MDTSPSPFEAVADPSPRDPETTGPIYPFVRTFPNPHAKQQRETSGGPALSRLALSTVLILLGLGGAMEMLALWWLQTPSSRVQNLSEELIMAAQLTGLLGGYLLLIEVALMARLPWLERRIGSWLASLHRYLGGYLMMLLTMHVGLVLAGYSLSLHAAVPTVLLGILRTYPDVLIATIAYLLLLGLGLSSIRKIRRRLGYERWHALHLVAYPAGVLAFGHEIAMGAQFTRNTYARDGWTLLNLAVAAAVLTHRFYLPVRRHLRHRLRISHIVAESPDTISVYITGIDIDQLNARGGQYFRWRFLARGVWHQTHPFSLSAHPTENTLRLTVKGVGAYTRRLKRRLRPASGCSRTAPTERSPRTSGGEDGVLADRRRRRRHPAARDRGDPRRQRTRRDLRAACHDRARPAHGRRTAPDAAAGQAHLPAGARQARQDRARRPDAPNRLRGRYPTSRTRGLHLRLAGHGARHDQEPEARGRAPDVHPLRALRLLTHVPPWPATELGVAMRTFTSAPWLRSRSSPRRSAPRR